MAESASTQPALLCALMYAANRGKESPTKDAIDFNPFAQRQRKRRQDKIPLRMWRGAFCGD